MKKILILIITACLSTIALGGNYIVIVNKDSPLSNVSTTDLKRVYTGKLTDINGNKVAAANLSLDDAAAESFLTEITGMNSGDYKSFWFAEQIRGGSTPPAAKKILFSIICLRGMPFALFLRNIYDNFGRLAKLRRSRARLIGFDIMVLMPVRMRAPGVAHGCDTRFKWRRMEDVRRIEDVRNRRVHAAVDINHRKHTMASGVQLEEQTVRYGKAHRPYDADCGPHWHCVARD